MAPASPTLSPIQVQRWRSERPLFVVALLVSGLLWLLATISIVGLVYALILGIFFFVMHVAFVAHVRGSGVRLGPNQFPELYARVRTLAVRMGITRMPEVYLMQAGGALNAFATRFLGANLVVLFSDLLEACGDNEGARDMILAHELGHIRAGHVRWHWVLLPSQLIPFLGTALSRAREYTCDRFGLAGAGDRDSALLGLTILAAGGRHGPLVNQRALVRQQLDLNTGWMTIGQWLSTHPPLAKRLAVLHPRLYEGSVPRSRGIVRALAILVLPIIAVGAISWFAATRLPALFRAGTAASAGAPAAYAVPESAADLVQSRFEELAAFIAAEQAAGRPLPADAAELYSRFKAANPGSSASTDPYDGWEFGYGLDEDGYVLWSSGPDESAGTADDIVFERAARRLNE